MSLGQFSFSTTSAVSHCVCLAFFRYISYPRTETNIFPKDLDLAALVEQQIPDPRWGAFARNILERGGPTPRNGNKSDQAHPPIHPTKYTDSLQVGIPGRLPRDPQGGQGSGLGSVCSVGSDFRNSVTENLSSLWGRDVISTLFPQSAPGFTEGSHRGCGPSRPCRTLSPPSTASLTLPRTKRPFAEPSHSPHLLPLRPGWSCSMMSDGRVRVLYSLGLL